MKTETQLRSEVYTALVSAVPTFWLSRPTTTQTFPLAVYRRIAGEGEYSFGVVRSAEDVIFAVDLYVDPKNIVEMDNTLDTLKTAMETINYRQVGSDAEFLETDINKVVRVTRWERYNV